MNAIDSKGTPRQVPSSSQSCGAKPIEPWIGLASANNTLQPPASDNGLLASLHYCWLFTSPSPDGLKDLIFGLYPVLTGIVALKGTVVDLVPFDLMQDEDRVAKVNLIAASTP